ncbi:MAG: hypothetical protein QM733_15740 [Ilumatobacteraceae bacterium]
MLKILDHDQLDDTEGDAALAILPPLPDNVTVVVRNLQAQISALAARVDELES